jgi:DNA polymerase-3 subunit delta
MAGKKATKVTPIDFNAFAQHIAHAAIAPVYVVAGPEELRRRRAIDLIQKRAEALGKVSPREIQCPQSAAEGAAVDIADVLDYLRSRTLFGGMSMVILRRADYVVGRSQKKESEEAEGEEEAPSLSARDVLLRYAAQPQKGSCLVIELEEEAKTSVASKLAASGVLVDCRALYDAPPPWQKGPAKSTEVTQWILAEVAAKHKKKISIDAAAEIADMVGGNLSRISGELEKLCLFVGDKAVIEPEDVEKSTGHVRTHGLFTLLDSIASRELGKSLRMLVEIFSRGMAMGKGDVVFDDNGIAVILIGQIHRRMATLRRARRMLSRGKRAADLQDEFRMARDWQAEKLAGQAMKFEEADFAQINRDLLNADEMLKTSQMPAQPLLESLLVKICRR